MEDGVFNEDVDAVFLIWVDVSFLLFLEELDGVLDVLDLGVLDFGLEDDDVDISAAGIGVVVDSFTSDPFRLVLPELD